MTDTLSIHAADELPRQEREEIIQALADLPSCKARLRTRFTADGSELTDQPEGTEYRVYPVTLKPFWMRHRTTGQPVQRLCFWVQRLNKPNDIGGFMPSEVFDIDTA